MLKYYHITEESAVELAKELKPALTTGKVTRMVKRSQARSNKANFPMLDFFPADIINDSNHPITQKLTFAVGTLMLQSKRPYKWAAERVMHDVLNGMITLKRRQQDDAGGIEEKDC